MQIDFMLHWISSLLVSSLYSKHERLNQQIVVVFSTLCYMPHTKVSQENSMRATCRLLLCLGQNKQAQQQNYLKL